MFPQLISGFVFNLLSDIEIQKSDDIFPVTYFFVIFFTFSRNVQKFNNVVPIIQILTTR